MALFKDPSLQDRLSRAADAKQKALDNLRAKPPIDESTAAKQHATSIKREAAASEKRDARKAAQQAEKEAKAAAKLAAIKPVRTEAELKAARDARYAARKNRK